MCSRPLNISKQDAPHTAFKWFANLFACSHSSWTEIMHFCSIMGPKIVCIRKLWGKHMWRPKHSTLIVPQALWFNVGALSLCLSHESFINIWKVLHIQRFITVYWDTARYIFLLGKIACSNHQLHWCPTPGAEGQPSHRWEMAGKKIARKAWN